MKALRWTPERREIALTDVPDPAISSPDQVILRMIEGGICGTDREIVRHGLGFPPDGRDSIIIGHEPLAEVVDTGRDVRAVRTGDLVSVRPRRPCTARCRQCRRGRADLCESGGALDRGITGLDGFFSEFVVESERHLFRIDPAMRPFGVLMEPAAVVEKAWQQTLDARALLFGRTAASRALILGAGPIGVLAALLATLGGTEVWAASLEPPDSRVARFLASCGVHYMQAGSLDASGFDVILDCTGSPSALLENFRRLAANGVAVVLGAPPAGTSLPVDAGAVMTQAILRNQVVMGSVNAGPEAWELAAEDLVRFERRRPGALASLISHRVDWKDAAPAFFGRAPDEIKVVMEFGR